MERKPIVEDKTNWDNFDMHKFCDTLAWLIGEKEGVEVTFKLRRKDETEKEDKNGVQM